MVDRRGRRRGPDETGAPVDLVGHDWAASSPHDSPRRPQPASARGRPMHRGRCAKDSCGTTSASSGAPRAPARTSGPACWPTGGPPPSCSPGSVSRFITPACCLLNAAHEQMVHSILRLIHCPIGWDRAADYRPSERPGLVIGVADDPLGSVHVCEEMAMPARRRRRGARPRRPLLAARSPGAGAAALAGVLGRPRRTLNPEVATFRTSVGNLTATWAGEEHGWSSSFRNTRERAPARLLIVLAGCAPSVGGPAAAALPTATAKIVSVSFSGADPLRSDRPGDRCPRRHPVRRQRHRRAGNGAHPRPRRLADHRHVRRVDQRVCSGWRPDRSTSRTRPPALV